MYQEKQSLPSRPQRLIVGGDWEEENFRKSRIFRDSVWNIFCLEYIFWVVYILVGIYSGWREGEKMLTLHSQPLQQALGCYLHFRTLAAPSGWDRPHRSTVTLGLQRPEWNRRRCHANHEWWKDVGTAVEGRGGWGAPISQSQGCLIMPGGVGGLTQLSPG